MANYKKVAEQILSTVGGAENVASVTHCMTRLRFSLKDESLSNDEKLEDISSIISVVHAGGQVQLVVGPTVDKVYDEVCKQGGFEVTVSIDEELDGPQLSWKERLAPKHLFNQLLDAVSGAITPILPIFCVAGIFKMLVILFGPEGAGFMSETSDLYRILSLVGDAAYYYFPVFAAYSSAKKFKTSPVLALLIAVVMIYPDMLAIVEDGKPFSVFGIPMQLVNYTQAVLPVILITWAQSYIERFFKKISPDMLRVLIVPVGTVLVMLPVALCLCGPAVQFV
ncbi:PTS transporter subunit EIIB, partial [Enterococcus durans]